MIRVAERQKAERAAFVASVASVAIPNSHLATTEQPQIDDLQFEEPEKLKYVVAALDHAERQPNY
jgi:hypothetical protein